MATDSDKSKRKTRTPKSEIDKLAVVLSKANTSNELRDFVDKFQLACTKKELLRTQSYMTLVDEVDDALINRFKVEKDDFDIDQIMDIKKLADASVDRCYKLMGNLKEQPQNITLIDKSTTINNTQVNNFDANSRSKITTAVTAILGLINKTQSAEELKEKLNGVEEVITVEDSTDKNTQETPVITDVKKEEK